MRKFLLLAALLLLLAMPALSETYSFTDIHAALTLDDSVYTTVLTQYNLINHTEWLQRNGYDYDAVFNEFENEGILLKAFDDKNGRVFTLTALQDLDAKTYFDLNNQDEDMRKEYRLSHTENTVYRILGYTYSSAQWQNYGKTALRFLKTKYALLNEDGSTSAGYQRRTIRNGYTITLDMQVKGRGAKEADGTALEKIMKTFTFTEILPMPDLPIKLSISSVPPAETSSDTFTIKGTSAKKADITVNVFGLSNTNSKTFTTIASSNGAFSVKVTMPTQGQYSVTVTASKEGAITAQKSYSVSYQKGILSVSLGSVPGETLGNNTVISGSMLSGSKAQLSVSGPVTYNKTVTGKSFNFNVDTSAEGTYTFILAITKKNMSERVFTYTGAHVYTQEERVAYYKASAKTLSYNNLSKAANKGKVVKLTGYITEISEAGGEWLVKVATKKNGSLYKEIVYVICTEKPNYAEGDKVLVYGAAAENYSKLSESGVLENYPRVEGAYFETAQ